MAANDPPAEEATPEPTRKTSGRPTPRSEIKRGRELTRPGPSGAVFTIRPLNLARHALAGGLPEEYLDFALADVNEKPAFDEDTLDTTDEHTRERLAAYQRYRDYLVRLVIVAPSMDPPKEGEDDPLDDLHPADYSWALGIAQNRVFIDGDGELLWGTEATVARFRAAAAVEANEGADRESGS